MKWKVVIGLSVIFMGIFASYLWSQGKDATAQQGKGVTPGVTVIRLWQTKIGPKKWPEIAILELSNTKYAEFKKDVSAFLNTPPRVFSKDVKPGAAVTELEPPPDRYDGPWTVACGHTMTSTSNCFSGVHIEGESGTQK